MKLNTLIPVFILFFSMSCLAQNRSFIKGKKDEIKAIKIAYITNELSLTPDEATKFWPLFNAFQNKQNEIKKQKLKDYLDRTDNDAIDKLSDKEAESLLSQMESSEDDLYQSRKKFIANLKGVISPIKILKLKKAEEGFNRKLLQQYRDKRKN